MKSKFIFEADNARYYYLMFFYFKKQSSEKIASIYIRFCKLNGQKTEKLTQNKLIINRFIKYYFETMNKKLWAIF